MKKICIITGASSGLGRMLVKAAKGLVPADEFWLISRSEEKLCKTAKEFGVENARIIPLDLTYDASFSELDRLLEKHGYKRDGKLYRAVNANNGTIVLFCHFGLEAVLLSHLLNISPMLLWHGFCAAPSSVTTVVTEERREGTAYFRVLSFGDTSHLYACGEKPAFSGRFVEKHGNEGERVD